MLVAIFILTCSLTLCLYNLREIKKAHKAERIALLEENEELSEQNNRLRDIVRHHGIEIKF